MAKAQLDLDPARLLHGWAADRRPRAGVKHRKGRQQFSRTVGVAPSRGDDPIPPP